MTARLRRLVGGASLTPLVVLFGLNLVDEFDRIAFAALTPELRDAFGLSDTGIAAIGIVATVFILLAALPIGYVADRFHRLRLAFFAALLWGTMSVLTGVVPAVALLFVVRLLSGIGRITNEVVHPSLLNDYYRSEHLPRVFQLHRLANPLGAVSGIVAGFIAGSFGWRWAFVLLALPTFVLIAGLTRLREPRRGETIDAVLAEEGERAEPVPFGEARRQLFAVRTLRRLWVAAFMLGIGALSIPQFLSLYFEHVYAFGPEARGVVQFLLGAGTAAGLFIGGSLASRAMVAGQRSRLSVLSGAGGWQFGLGVTLLALSPWSVLSAAAVLVVGLGIGSYQPAYFPLVGLVAPPRVRSQAYAWAILWAGLGGFLSILLFVFAEANGYREAMGILAVVTTVAGFVATSSHRFVERDADQAAATLATAQRLRAAAASSGGHALLTCSGVEVAYDQVQVLFGVDLEVAPGEVVALLGTNGAGKSTLLRAISGLTDPIGGAIFFDGRDITHADPVQTANLGIAQVPGGKAVFPTLTVREHLRLAGWLYRDEPAYLRHATDEVLETFPRLREREEQMAGNLSGGEQQMLALGMAFIARPKLLMIDELSLGLAPAVVEQLLAILRRIRDQGTAIVLVEQSINVAMTVADRAYFMEKGEVRFSGLAQELLDRDDIVRSVFLEGAGRALEEARSAPGGAAVVQVESVPSRNGEAGPPVLQILELSKAFGGIRAVDGVTFSLRPHEVLGLIGPNGAGKTTIFDLVSGFLAPDAGRVVLDGEDVTGLRPDRRAWRGLGRSFQDARLVPSLTVAENLALGLERHLELRDHVASALGLPAVVRLEEDVAWSVADLVELLHLEAYRDKFVRELSTGTRRIVDLAMCIAHDPKVLLLDEPSSGIAQRETEALGPLLERIRRETGCALLVIEHDMPLITAVSDRMIALDLGRPLAEGTPAEVTSNPLVVSAYLGGDPAAVRRSGKLEPA